MVSAALRKRMGDRLLVLDRKRARDAKALSRDLGALKSRYRVELRSLLGKGRIDRYVELRAELKGASRSRKKRESRAMLDEIGVDLLEVARIGKSYFEALRSRLTKDTLKLAALRHIAGRKTKNPWVTYSAPFDGDFWSWAWSRGDEADDPILSRVLDSGTGRIGSSVATRLGGADDDEFVSANYYTSLFAWHTALSTGPIEGYLAFTFNRSPYSGDVQDEFGLSHAIWNQWARARFRVVDSQGLSDTQEAKIFNVIDHTRDYEWGNDDGWESQVAAPGDVHWYHFKTDESFAKGSSLLLEAGVWNYTWFDADDTSVSTLADLDFTLDFIKVRSCPP